MNNWFINNRELIKNLAINTGTSSVPVYTGICTTSEVQVATDLETKDFYVFCDAIQRRITTGAAMGLSGTLKIDVNNAGVTGLLDNIHTLLADGEIAQFNNQLIQFDLLTGISNGTLEYTTYQVATNLTLSDLGGAAEDEGEFGITVKIIGTGTVVSA